MTFLSHSFRRKDRSLNCCVGLVDSSLPKSNRERQVYVNYVLNVTKRVALTTVFQHLFLSYMYTMHKVYNREIILVNGNENKPFAIESCS